MDQQHQQQQQPPEQYKYYCKVCKKGFGCGRALGGHMRAHGINDDYASNALDADADDDASHTWGGEPDSSPSPHKRMYALRTNPNRLKTCRVCENCGKEFLSWKSFLEHGKCTSDDDDDLGPTDSYYLSSDEDDSASGWSKGKQTRASSRPRFGSSNNNNEDEYLANCLMMLSSARVESTIDLRTEDEYYSLDHHSMKLKSPIFQYHLYQETTTAAATAAMNQVPKGMFECKACKKVFTSHQALGGHRASHKKVKGCFAARLDDVQDAAPTQDPLPTSNVDEDVSVRPVVEGTTVEMAIVPFTSNVEALDVAPLSKKLKVHECSICHRQFASGQALGGHKRCHWITNAAEQSVSRVPGMMNGQQHLLTLSPPVLNASDAFDLNRPVSTEGRNPLNLELGSSLYLQCNVNGHGHGHGHKSNEGLSKNKGEDDVEGCSNNRDNNNNNNNNVEDEVESRANKIVKLSELKDVSESGGEVSGPWLQVGIGSSGNVDATSDQLP